MYLQSTKVRIDEVAEAANRAVEPPLIAAGEIPSL